ncbi:dihydrofolate reductase [Bacillus phage W.Ph.]|uniref:dihydrofolate reductase n=1 Tax=Bacillus phage W.Ph. TaxID=764595 RepID=G9B1Z5_9CAUD|nr:dihydrofolate reductase [Bacillus phage W.Ph.]ADH03390.1 gp244 [Bacillus phage W.Ph.]
MIISSIVARDRNGAIGRNNELLFKASEDMKWFKQNTMGKVVVMGARTHESIGIFLKGRINVVLTRNREYVPLDKDVKVFHNIHEMLNYFKDEKEIMIIGGGQIYEQFAPMVNRHYITEIKHAFKDADTFYPPFDTNVYKEFYPAFGRGIKHFKNDIEFEFKVYKKVD